MATIFRLNKPAYYRAGEDYSTQLSYGRTITGYALRDDILEWLCLRPNRPKIWDQSFSNGDGRIYLGYYIEFKDIRAARSFVLNWDYIASTFKQETLL